VSYGGEGLEARVAGARVAAGQALEEVVEEAPSGGKAKAKKKESAGGGKAGGAGDGKRKQPPASASASASERPVTRSRKAL
jgi:hypothetical protein